MYQAAHRIFPSDMPATLQRQQSNEGIAETLIAHLAPMALNLAMLFFIFVMLQYCHSRSLLLFTAVLNLAVTACVREAH